MIVRKIKSEYDRIQKEKGKIVTADIRRISARNFREIKNEPKHKIFRMCEQLLDAGYTTVPFDWAYRMEKRYAKTDFRRFEYWLKEYVDDWNKCDDFCTHALGVFVHRFPEAIGRTEKWARSKSRWQRRASAVVLIYSIRRFQWLKEIFKRADILLTDSDDMVQKGYGWMLKETANHSPQQVFDFVMKRRKIMPRRSLRYAIEKMPPAWKKRAMAKDW
jgi:3-methyladenine DNA glycosylase AlkD